jgi:hypothetical protein
MIILENGKVMGCTQNVYDLPVYCKDCELKNTVSCTLSMYEDFEQKPDPIYEDTAKAIGNLVAEKQLQYGDSFGNAGKVLKVLYPNGISFDQMEDALVVVRIVDKLFRVANNNMGEEDAFQDITGYGLLAVVRNKRKED